MAAYFEETKEETPEYTPFEGGALDRVLNEVEGGLTEILTKYKPSTLHGITDKNIVENIQFFLGILRTCIFPDFSGGLVPTYVSSPIHFVRKHPIVVAQIKLKKRLKEKLSKRELTFIKLRNSVYAKIQTSGAELTADNIREILNTPGLVDTKGFVSEDIRIARSVLIQHFDIFFRNKYVESTDILRFLFLPNSDLIFEAVLLILEKIIELPSLAELFSFANIDELRKLRLQDNSLDELKGQVVSIGLAIINSPERLRQIAGKKSLLARVDAVNQRYSDKYDLYWSELQNAIRGFTSRLPGIATFDKFPEIITIDALQQLKQAYIQKELELNALKQEISDYEKTWESHATRKPTEFFKYQESGDISSCSVISHINDLKEQLEQYESILGSNYIAKNTQLHGLLYTRFSGIYQKLFDEYTQLHRSGSDKIEQSVGQEIHLFEKLRVLQKEITKAIECFNDLQLNVNELNKLCKDVEKMMEGTQEITLAEIASQLESDNSAITNRIDELDVEISDKQAEIDRQKSDLQSKKQSYDKTPLDTILAQIAADEEKKIEAIKANLQAITRKLAILTAYKKFSDDQVSTAESKAAEDNSTTNSETNETKPDKVTTSKSTGGAQSWNMLKVRTRTLRRAKTLDSAALTPLTSPQEAFIQKMMLKDNSHTPHITLDYLQAILPEGEDIEQKIPALTAEIAQIQQQEQQDDPGIQERLQARTRQLEILTAYSAFLQEQASTVAENKSDGEGSTGDEKAEAGKTNRRPSMPTLTRAFSALSMGRKSSKNSGTSDTPESMVPATTQVIPTQEQLFIEDAGQKNIFTPPISQAELLGALPADGNLDREIAQIQQEQADLSSRKDSTPQLFAQRRETATKQHSELGIELGTNVPQQISVLESAILEVQQNRELQVLYIQHLQEISAVHAELHALAQEIGDLNLYDASAADLKGYKDRIKLQVAGIKVKLKSGAFTQYSDYSSKFEQYLEKLKSDFSAKYGARSEQICANITIETDKLISDLTSYVSNVGNLGTDKHDFVARQQAIQAEYDTKGIANLGRPRLTRLIQEQEDLIDQKFQDIFQEICASYSDGVKQLKSQYAEYSSGKLSITKEVKDQFTTEFSELETLKQAILKDAHDLGIADVNLEDNPYNRDSLLLLERRLKAFAIINSYGTTSKYLLDYLREDLEADNYSAVITKINAKLQSATNIKLISVLQRLKAYLLDNSVAEESSVAESYADFIDKFAESSDANFVKYKTAMTQITTEAEELKKLAGNADEVIALADDLFKFTVQFAGADVNTLPSKNEYDAFAEKMKARLHSCDHILKEAGIHPAKWSPTTILLAVFTVGLALAASLAYTKATTGTMYFMWQTTKEQDLLKAAESRVDEMEDLCTVKAG